MSNIPKIRFKTFNDDWVPKRLSDFCNIFAGGTPSTSNENFWKDGTINWIPSGLVQNCVINDKDINTKITQLGLKNSSAKLIKSNTTILAITGATCGKTAYLQTESSANQSVMAFETNELNSLFLFYIFQTNKNEILKYQAGGAQAGINKSTCENFIFNFPSDKEQDKIAKMFSKLDNLINLLKSKNQKLLNLKITLLQKMFPFNNKIPTIRFKKCNCEYKKIKLVDFGKSYTGLSGKTKQDFGHGSGYFIPYLNVFNNPIVDVELFEPIEIDKSQNLVKKGDILFTVSSETPEDVGMSSVLTTEYKNLYLNSFCFGYRFNNINEFDLNYFAYMLRSAKLRQLISFLAQGISRYNISKNKVLQIEFFVPDDKEEQRKIGNFFVTLDNLIIQIKKKILKLENIKETLLQKMFC